MLITFYSYEKSAFSNYVSLCKKYKKEQRIIPESLNAKQGELLMLLREKRTELARKRRVPPYLIFSDRSLEDIACQQPTDQNAFSQIHGVGAVKLRDFGSDFIKVVNNFVCE